MNDVSNRRFAAAVNSSSDGGGILSPLGGGSNRSRGDKFDDTAGVDDPMWRDIGEVNFYNDVPNYELNLDEFEQLALKRLKVLCKIEEHKARNITGDAYIASLKSTIKSNLLQPPSSSSSESSSSLSKSELRSQLKKIDVASHHILRAAFCRTEDDRRWFLTHECHLFRFRLHHLITIGTDNALRSFLVRSSIPLNRVSNQEKKRLTTHLLSIPNVTHAEVVSTPYYAIPYTEALDLVSKRQCYVRGGLAYVPQSKLETILIAKFRSRVSKSLVMASMEFGSVLESETDRLRPLLLSMKSQYTGKDRYTDGSMTATGQDELTASNIDQYVPSMPLCMSQLHTGLKSDHKLKFWGRSQYLLFLKGAGLSMEESLLFFSREYGKIMTTDQFNKNYSYNIRHMYGKEGKRVSYTPYNCTKIILGQSPQSGDHHGCPYKHYDEAHLSALLNKMKIGNNPSERDVILSHKRNGNYQLACQKHFELVHPNASNVQNGVDLDGVGMHPNAWFRASVSYRAAMMTTTTTNTTDGGGGSDGVPNKNGGGGGGEE